MVQTVALDDCHPMRSEGSMHSVDARGIHSPLLAMTGFP
jgi:hypothetical protein